MSYAIADIITWGKISQALSLMGEAKKKAFNAFGAIADEDLHIKIYDARMSLEWENEQNPSGSQVFSLGNYLLALIGEYLSQAQQISISGGYIVVPTVPQQGQFFNIAFYIVKKVDFSGDATDYFNAALVGKDISVFFQNLNRYLEEDEFALLSDGTVRILLTDFDSQDFQDNKIIMRVDVNGEASVTGVQTEFSYDLTGATAISSLPTVANGTIRTVSIRPNGYAYTWPNTFVFNDSYPEQPDAIDANTLQIYTFKYVSGVGDVCVDEALNIAV